MKLRAAAGLCLLTTLAVSTGTSAQSTPHAIDSQALQAALFPDAYAAQTARDQAQSADIARLLRTLPNVRAAEVTYQRIHPAEVPLDAPLPPPQLIIALTTEGVGPPADALDELLKIVRSQNKSGTIQVIQVPVTERDGGAQLAQKGSETAPFRTFLALSLAANVVLATVLLLRMRRRV